MQENHLSLIIPIQLSNACRNASHLSHHWLKWYRLGTYSTGSGTFTRVGKWLFNTGPIKETDGQRVAAYGLFLFPDFQGYTRFPVGYVKCSSDGKLPTEMHFFPAASVCGFWYNRRWKYGSVAMMVNHVNTAFSQRGFQTCSHSVVGWLTHTCTRVFIRLELFASSFTFISPTSSVLTTHTYCKLQWGFLPPINFISPIFPLGCLAQWCWKRRKPCALWKMLFKSHIL